MRSASVLEGRELSDGDSRFSGDEERSFKMRNDAAYLVIVTEVLIIEFNFVIIAKGIHTEPT